MFAKTNIKYGDILWVQFEPSVGHEFRGKRPALVIQSDEQLAKSNLITVVPLTGKINKKMKEDIIINPDSANGLSCSSVVKVFEIISIDGQRIDGKIGQADANIMTQMQKYLKVHFNIQ